EAPAVLFRSPIRKMLQDFESAPPPGMKLLTERLKKREEERDKEDPDERGREHAREGRDADGSTA
ncbi:MAG TPA: hypothetical protein DEW97_10015, partial [Sutterella wadsworthensis]|nr:hypothetical protein [Sutterella wadsworthensis]